MTSIIVGIIGIVILLLVMLLCQIPVSFVMILVGFLGVCYMVSIEAAFHILSTDIWLQFSSYGLTVIPLFIFMGYLAFNSGIGERLYNSAYKWIGHWPGGLAMATIAADELFAAICGSNTATVATVGAVALPQMKKYNYSSKIISGTVATGGTLGVVMPPSVVFIVIGLQTEQSIIKLFLAGILPAILLGLLYVLTILFVCKRHPEYGPPGPRTNLKEKIRSLSGIIEAIVVFLLVIGGLYAGLFTPTEAGAAGAFLVFIIGVATRRLNWEGITNSITETLWVSCMVFVLITGATIFGRFLTITRLPFELADWASALPVSRYIILAFVLFIYLIGGCIMDSLGLLILTLPIFFPLGIALGFDPIWYSVILCIVTTIGAITPPVGVNLYVVKALAPEIGLGTIYKSAAMFLLACIICLIILIIFPQIVLLIPKKL